MNYESEITTKVKEILSLADMGVSQDEHGILERQLNEDDIRLAEWVAEEQSKPSLVRDLKKEKIAIQSLAGRIEAVLKPVRDSKKKSAEIVQERQDKKAAALAECTEICRRAHAELTRALQSHGVRADDIGEAIYKVLAYASLAK